MTEKPLTKQDLEKLGSVLDSYAIPEKVSCKNVEFYVREYLWSPDKKRIIGGLYTPDPPAKGIIRLEQEEEYPKMPIDQLSKLFDFENNVK